ncbi:S-layer homology domain-containing protein [Pseudoflavonifractor phocaeensis]|nr:S-layer homology domain-containing protein [Pseudoflavonifractor phocaeensis]
MVEEKEFTDLQYYGDPYKTDQENFPAIFALQRTGIIDGYPDGSFGPNDGITRAQAAKILDLFTDIPGLEVRRYDQ